MITNGTTSMQSSLAPDDKGRDPPQTVERVKTISDRCARHAQSIACASRLIVLVLASPQDWGRLLRAAPTAVR